MSKSCCFALVLAAICLSLEADAQPTVDETMTCGSSTLEEVVNMVKKIRDELRDEISNIKKMIKSGSENIDETSRLEDVVKEIKDPSKQALVSALVSEYLVSLYWHIYYYMCGLVCKLFGAVARYIDILH